MTYGDIIRKNLQNYPWSKYAYHFTDVPNAVNILAEGRLYSRNRAKAKGLMVNDNASEKIIAYNDFVADYVRFYFRPLTPTQYYNEGYKHPDFRFEHNKNANITVPVFFLLDLESMLESGQMKFSSTTLAGYNPSRVFTGVQNFTRLPFERIYSSPWDKENKKFRHAELICRDEFPLSLGHYLKGIVCRNEIEAITLINLLAEKNPALAEAYKHFIIFEECFGNDLVKPILFEQETKLFECNGLFISNIYCPGGDLMVVDFSETASKKSYDAGIIRFNPACRNAEVEVRLDVKIKVQKGNLAIESIIRRVNYCSPESIVIEWPEIECYEDWSSMKIFFDDYLVAYGSEYLGFEC